MPWRSFQSKTNFAGGSAKPTVRSGQLRVPRHDAYFTIGEGVAGNGIGVPGGGGRWIAIRPPVSLERWTPAFDPGCDRFTTVSIWDSDDYVVDRDVTYANTKREAFLAEYPYGPIRVEPLAHFPVIRDLVVDIDDFMEKLPDVKAWLIPKEAKSPEEGEYLQTPAEMAAYKRFSMCINCMLCYSACPVYGLDSTFTGPAALALAQRYSLDSRDGGRAERADVLGRHEGI